MCSWEKKGHGHASLEWTWALDMGMDIWMQLVENNGQMMPFDCQTLPSCSRPGNVQFGAVCAFGTGCTDEHLGWNKVLVNKLKIMCFFFWLLSDCIQELQHFVFQLSGSNILQACLWEAHCQKRAWLVDHFYAPHVQTWARLWLTHGHKSAHLKLCRFQISQFSWAILEHKIATFMFKGVPLPQKLQDFSLTICKVNHKQSAVAAKILYTGTTALFWRPIWQKQLGLHIWSKNGMKEGMFHI